MNGFFLLQAALALAAGHSALTHQNQTSPVRSTDLMEQAASVGLVEPTSPAIYAEDAVETSPEGIYIQSTHAPKATGAKVNSTKEFTIATEGSSEGSNGQVGGVLNVLGGGDQGDLHGANPRQNLVYFGVGRHGFGFGAECDGCLSGCSGCNGCSGYNGYNDNRGREPAPCGSEPNHNAEPNREPNQPYLKVTPTLNVQTHTRTHVETRTSAVYDVATSYRTRTVTDELKSTKTDYVHPEKTYTYVEYQTLYEYPAATIDANNVRHPNEGGSVNRNAGHPC